MEVLFGGIKFTFTTSGDKITINVDNEMDVAPITLYLNGGNGGVPSMFESKAIIELQPILDERNKEVIEVAKATMLKYTGSGTEEDAKVYLSGAIAIEPTWPSNLFKEDEKPTWLFLYRPKQTVTGGGELLGVYRTCKLCGKEERGTVSNRQVTVEDVRF